MIFDIVMLIFNIVMYGFMLKLNKIPPVSSKAMIFWSMFYSLLIVFWIVYLIVDIHRWPTRIWF